MHKIIRWGIICGLLATVLLTVGCSKGYVPYDYKLDDYIELAEYKGVSYDYVNIGANEEELQQAIWTDMKANGYGDPETVLTGKVLYGDVLILDLTGNVDGVQDDTLTAKGISLEVGAGVFFEEFESKLIGKAIGQMSTISVTFPEDYVKIAYAGKTVEYSVSVLSAKRQKYPELTDTIVSEISDCKTVEEYNRFMENKLEEQSVIEADEQSEAQVWDSVVEAAKVKEYPEKAMKYLREQLIGEFEKEADANGQSYEEFLKENGISSDEFNAYIEARAKKICKEEMVMNAIARAEGIKAEKAEIENLAEQYAENYDYDSVSELYKTHSKEMIEQTILFQKVKDFLLANAKQIA